MRRTFGTLFAASALTLVIVLSSISPPVAAAPTNVVAGDGRVSWLKVFGVLSGDFPGGPVFSDTIFCGPCVVSFTVIDSQYSMIGTGTTGTLAPGFTYDVAMFYGVVNVQEIGQRDAVLELQGVADSVTTS